MFENLQSVVQSIDPAKLNSVLSAVAEALRGKGDVIGQAITDANNVLLAVNPRMPTVQQDWQLFGKTTQAYSDAAQDILSILDSFSTTSTTITANAQALDAAAAVRGRILPVGHQHDRRKPAQPGARASNILRSDDRAAEQVFADLHLPVPGCPVVPGARRTRCTGRQRQISHHGRRAADRRRPVPLSGQPADGQRQGRPRRQAELRLAARRQQELPGEVPRHRHRFRHRAGRPAQPRHRLPRLSPTTSRSPRRIREPPRIRYPGRSGAGPAAGLPRGTALRRTAVRAGRNAAVPAAATGGRTGTAPRLPHHRQESSHETQEPGASSGWCCSPRCAWSSCSCW